MEANPKVEAGNDGDVREIVGLFDTLDTLQAAVDELLISGFDRSEISLLAEDGAVQEKAGSMSAAELEDSAEAPRTAYIESESLNEGKASLVGILFYIGAFAGAGAMVAAGASVGGAVAAGALAGICGGAIGFLLSRRIGDRQTKWLKSQLARGGLLLWARTWTKEREQIAIGVMERNGAHDVHVRAPAQTQLQTAG